MATATAPSKQCRACGTTYTGELAEFFQPASSFDDGFWPKCRTCETVYSAWYRARKAAAKDPDNAELQTKVDTAEAAWLERKAMGESVLTDRRHRKATTTDDQVVDGTANQSAEIAALDANLDAVGVTTDEGQALLEKAAEDAKAARRAADAERKRRERAAKKAKAQA